MLIIKCWMLKVKHLTIFKQNKWRGFWPRLPKKSSSARFYFPTQCRVLAWFLKKCSVSNASGFRALALISIELGPLSPSNLWKRGFFIFFSSKWPPPPPQEESKCKNAQFLQWILKDDDVYFKKITASEIWGNSFIVKNIGLYTTCCRRHIASLGHKGLISAYAMRIISFCGSRVMH